jgi:hypothetical protein
VRRIYGILPFCWAATVFAVAQGSGDARTTAGPTILRDALSVTFLYELTIGVTNQAVSKDQGLKILTQELLSNLKSDDALRFGFVARRLFLSRRFAASELTDFYGKVVATTIVPDDERFGPTPLWDELYRVVSTVADDEGRHAIIVVTDGRSTGNLRGLDELIAHARDSGVSISAMNYAPSEWFLSDRGERAKFAANPADLMLEIATATGGKYVVIPAAPATFRGGSVDFKRIRKGMRTRMAAIFEDLRR